MVIARTPALARDALELVEVDWAPLPAVATIADALAEDAPQLWSGAPKNLCFSETYGDSAKTGAAIAAARRGGEAKLGGAGATSVPAPAPWREGGASSPAFNRL